MNLASNHYESAANLYAAGAVQTMVDHEDPRHPIVYMPAAGQDASQGFVHLTMTGHSQRLLAAREDRPTARNKYAGLGGGAAAKPGQAANQLQMNDRDKYAALMTRANIRPVSGARRASLKGIVEQTPAPKAVAKRPAVVAPVTKTVLVGTLAVRKEPVRNPDSLAGRYQHWSASYGFAHNLAPC